MTWNQKNLSFSHIELELALQKKLIRTQVSVRKRSTERNRIKVYLESHENLLSDFLFKISSTYSGIMYLVQRTETNPLNSPVQRCMHACIHVYIYIYPNTTIIKFPFEHLLIK